MQTLRILIAFIRKDLLTYTSYRLQAILGVWGVALMFVHYIFLARIIESGALSAYGGRYFPFAILGVAFAHFFDMSLNGLSRQIRQGQTLGTLEALLMTPTPAWVILVGLVAFQFLYSSLLALGYITAGVAIANLHISTTAIVGTLTFLVLTLFAFVGLGMIAAAFILVFKRGEPIAWVFQGLSYLLSGVYYPVSVLPEPMQQLSQLLPLTHSMEAIRRLWLGGAAASDVAKQAMILILFGLVLIPIGLVSFNHAMKRAKEEGSLGQF